MKFLLTLVVGIFIILGIFATPIFLLGHSQSDDRIYEFQTYWEQASILFYFLYIFLIISFVIKFEMFEEDSEWLMRLLCVSIFFSLALGPLTWWIIDKIIA